MLVGRESERSALDALLQSARGERSAALVLRGEPGIGKTALLEYAADRARDMTVLRCVGIEAEYELPFAGMHQLVRPCLELVDRLPAPQAAALRGALGLSFDGVQDRFLVSAGLLSLLAEACDAGPVLCCVDDAQWLDPPSAEALVFAARRFQAEPIALLMAARVGDGRHFDAPGLAELEVDGLDHQNAHALLSARLDRAVAPDVVDRLLRTAHGNPLALLELPSALSDAQLHGVEPIVGPPPVRGAVEAAFGARVAALPDAARRVLLLAAADEAGDLATVRHAAQELGLALADLDDAEREGLVRIDAGVAFRHPLVRSAVYRAATRSERRQAHEALAAATSDPVSRAWHRAVVADHPDEALAGELEGAAAQAVARAAHATAAVTFQRAADLSEKEPARGRRLRGAAQASLDAGRLDAALALVERARRHTDDPGEAAHLDLIRATEASRRGSPAEGSTMLRDAARAVANAAPELATELALWSLFTGLQGGWDERLVTAGQSLLERIDTDRPVGRFADDVVHALSAYYAGDTATAGGRFAAALETGASLDGLRTVAMPIFVWTITGDWSRAREHCTRVVARLRAEGNVAGLAGLLGLMAFTELGERRMREAQASVSEGLELARALGYENDETGLLGVQARIAALHGDADACRVAGTAPQRAQRRGLGDHQREARPGRARAGPRGPARGAGPLRPDRRRADPARRDGGGAGPDRCSGARRRARACDGHAGALRGVGAGQPCPLGTRHARPLSRGARRGRRGRAPVPGGPRAAHARGATLRAGSHAARVRRAPAPRPAQDRGARAAAFGPRDVRGRRREPLGATRPWRAQRHGRDRTQARRLHHRRPHAPGAAHRPARRRRREQP